LIRATARTNTTNTTMTTIESILTASGNAVYWVTCLTLTRRGTRQSDGRRLLCRQLRPAEKFMQKRHRPSLFATLFGRLSKSKTPAIKEVVAPKPFQSIGIYHGTVCCAAAKNIDGQRFLAKHAPQLPLKECTLRSKCECKYIKFSDRRSSPRRLIEYGIKSTLFGASERRNRQGRRSKD